MSISFSEPKLKPYRTNHFHRRKESGELHVFDAARYYSGAKESFLFDNNSAQIRRISLDTPFNRTTLNPNRTIKDTNKAYKQPISPGRKLAKMLNSLFNRKFSRKMKSSNTSFEFSYSSTSQSVKEDEINKIGKKRRSSISHFPVVKNTSDFSSVISHTSSLSGLNPGQGHNPTRMIQNDEKIWSRNYSVLVDENFGFRKEDRVIVDDGGDSDSSSDLFELKSEEFGYSYSTSGLPIYENTTLTS